jgi:5'-nucleotidase/UDP-sugar diphosphatase
MYVIKFLVLYFILFLQSLFAVEIIIYHTNDMHGYAEETDTSIGYAKIATILEQDRLNKKNVLFLDAGDTLYGSLFANLSKGESIVEILTAMKIDALAVGNHDFSYGAKYLKSLDTKIRFPMLSANVLDDRGQLLLTPRIIKTFDGVKIGIFGITTPETLFKTNPENIKDLAFVDPRRVAQDQVGWLKREGADFIIALTHLGMDESTDLANRSTYLTTIPGIDLIIDGHSQTLLKNGEMLNNTFIAQVGEKGEYLGKIILDIKKDQNNISIGVLSYENLANAKPNKKILDIIDKYNKRYKVQLNNIITEIPYDLDGDRDTTRLISTNLGMLITDAVRKKTEADIAFVNAGMIRGSIKKGHLKYKDYYNIIPYDTTVITVEMSGEEIIKVLENSVSKSPAPDSRFLQVSGINFIVNNNVKRRSKISGVTVGGLPIDLNKKYTVAINTYLYQGGDRYIMFKNKAIMQSFSSVSDIFLEYLKTTDLENYKFDKRIIFVN